jgi:hypothetical protein
MKTTTEHIRAHILRQLPPIDPLPRPVTLEYVMVHQSSSELFDRLRRNRIAQGFFRYHHNLKSGERGKYNAVDDAIERLRRYRDDGNQEHLVDAANLCMIEFANPACHPSPHFTPTDDGEHASPQEVP